MDFEIFFFKYYFFETIFYPKQVFLKPILAKNQSGKHDLVLCTVLLLLIYFVILCFQARIRGLQARLRHQNLVRNAKAKIIQTNLRGWLARKKYQRSIQRVVIVQCQVRRFLAKKQFKKLKIEAKSIHHQKKLNKGTVIQNRIISSGKSAISWHQNLKILKHFNNFLSFFSSI